MVSLEYITCPFSQRSEKGEELFFTKKQVSFCITQFITWKLKWKLFSSLTMYLERYFLPYLTWIILLLEVKRTMKLLHFFILDIISWCWTWFSQSFWQSFLNAKTSFCFVQNKKSLLQNFLHIHIGTRISKWTIFL